MMSNINVCRLCLKYVQESEQWGSVNRTSGDTVSGAAMLKTLVPELYLGRSDDPIICTPCYNTLKDAYCFRLQCLRSENLIGIYMKDTGYNNVKIVLENVVDYWVNIYKTNPNLTLEARENLAKWFGLEGTESSSSTTAKYSDVKQDAVIAKNVAPETSSADSNTKPADKINTPIQEKKQDEAPSNNPCPEKYPVVDDVADITKKLQEYQELMGNLQKLGLAEVKSKEEESALKKFVVKSGGAYRFTYLPKKFCDFLDNVVEAKKIDPSKTSELNTSDKRDENQPSTQSKESVSNEKPQNDLAEILPLYATSVPTTSDNSLSDENSLGIIKFNPDNSTTQTPSDKPMPLIRVKPVSALQKIRTLNHELFPIHPEQMTSHEANNANGVRPVAIPLGPLSDGPPLVLNSQIGLNSASLENMKQFTHKIQPKKKKVITKRKPQVRSLLPKGTTLVPVKRSEVEKMGIDPEKLQKLEIRMPYRSQFLKKLDYLSEQVEYNDNIRVKIRLNPANSSDKATNSEGDNGEDSAQIEKVHADTSGKNSEKEVLDDFEMVDIKEEPMNYNEVDPLAGLGSDGPVLNWDDESTRTASELSLVDQLVGDDLSGLICDIPELHDEEFDRPEFVHINNVSFAEMTELFKKSRELTEQKRKEGKQAAKMDNVKVTSKHLKRLRIIPVDADKEVPQAKKGKISTVEKFLGYEETSIIPPNFTDEGDYINDHDYFVSPYQKINCSLDKGVIDTCHCLMCDLIHPADDHLTHMKSHSTTCTMCKVDFHNVFLLNLHMCVHANDPPRDSPKQGGAIRQKPKPVSPADDGSSPVTRRRNVCVPRKDEEYKGKTRRSRRLARSSSQSTEADEEEACIYDKETKTFITPTAEKQRKSKRSYTKHKKNEITEENSSKTEVALETTDKPQKAITLTDLLMDSKSTEPSEIETGKADEQKGEDIPDSITLAELLKESKKTNKKIFLPEKIVKKRRRWQNRSSRRKRKATQRDVIPQETENNIAEDKDNPEEKATISQETTPADKLESPKETSSNSSKPPRLVKIRQADSRKASKSIDNSTEQHFSRNTPPRLVKITGKKNVDKTPSKSAEEDSDEDVPLITFSANTPPKLVKIQSLKMDTVASKDQITSNEKEIVTNEKTISKLEAKLVRIDMSAKMKKEKFHINTLPHSSANTPSKLREIESSKMNIVSFKEKETNEKSSSKIEPKLVQIDMTEKIKREKSRKSTIPPSSSNTPPKLLAIKSPKMDTVSNEKSSSKIESELVKNDMTGKIKKEKSNKNIFQHSSANTAPKLVEIQSSKIDIITSKDNISQENEMSNEKTEPRLVQEKNKGEISKKSTLQSTSANIPPKLVEIHSSRMDTLKDQIAEANKLTSNVSSDSKTQPKLVQIGMAGNIKEEVSRQSTLSPSSSNAQSEPVKIQTTVPVSRASSQNQEVSVKSLKAEIQKKVRIKPRKKYSMRVYSARFNSAIEPFKLGKMAATSPVTTKYSMQEKKISAGTKITLRIDRSKKSGSANGGSNTPPKLVKIDSKTSVLDNSREMVENKQKLMTKSAIEESDPDNMETRSTESRSGFEGAKNDRTQTKKLVLKVRDFAVEKRVLEESEDCFKSVLNVSSPNDPPSIVHTKAKTIEADDTSDRLQSNSLSVEAETTDLETLCGYVMETLYFLLVGIEISSGGFIFVLIIVPFVYLDTLCGYLVVMESFYFLLVGIEISSGGLISVLIIVPLVCETKVQENRKSATTTLVNSSLNIPAPTDDKDSSIIIDDSESDKSETTDELKIKARPKSVIRATARADSSIPPLRLLNIRSKNSPANSLILKRFLTLPKTDVIKKLVGHEQLNIMNNPNKGVKLIKARKIQIQSRKQSDVAKPVLAPPVKLKVKSIKLNSLVKLAEDKNIDKGDTVRNVEEQTMANSGGKKRKREEFTPPAEKEETREVSEAIQVTPGELKIATTRTSRSLRRTNSIDKAEESVNTRKSKKISGAESSEEAKLRLTIPKNIESG